MKKSDWMRNLNMSKKQEKKKVILYSLFLQGPKNDQSKTCREHCPIIVGKKSDRAHYLNRGIEVPQSYIDGNKILGKFQLLQEGIEPRSPIPKSAGQHNELYCLLQWKGFTSLQVNLKKKKKKLLWEVLMPGAGIEPGSPTWRSVLTLDYLSHAKIRK